MPPIATKALRLAGGLGVAVALATTGGISAAVAGKADDTLVWTSNKELPIVIPYFNQNREIVVVGANVWDTLIYRNPETSEYQPLLAKSFAWADDRTIDLELREGVRFHDGSTFSADDVVETLTRVTQPDSGVVIRSFVDWIERVEKLGPMKVRIIAKKPYPAAIEMLSGPTPIFPKGIWSQARKNAAGKDDYGTMPPIGSGPYRISQVRPGESFTMVANEAYFDGPKPKAKIRTVVYKTILDRDAALAELLTGSVNWVPYVSIDQARQLQRRRGIEVVTGATVRVSLLGLDVTGRSGETPLKDLRVRQAIAHAIDRKAIAANLIGGGAGVIHSGCFPAQTGCTDDGVQRYDYDPQKSRALLAAAGYPNGFSTEIYAFREREYTEAVVNYLRAVGIKADLKFLQLQTMEKLMNEGKTPIYMHSYGSGGIFDVSAILSVFFKGDGFDYCRDPNVTDWVARGDTTTDPVKRKQLYRSALQAISQSLCWAPLFSYGSHYAVSADLNFKPNAAEIHEWFRASWK